MTTPRQPMDHQRKTPRTRSAKPGRFDSVTRRLHNLRQVAARVNSGVVTVAQYLAEIGADSDTIRRYAATLGKHVKAAYIAKFGVEPARSGLAVVGRRLVRSLAYDAGDVEILRAATASYGRVSHLLNGDS